MHAYKIEVMRFFDGEIDADPDLQRAYEADARTLAVRGESPAWHRDSSDRCRARPVQGATRKKHRQYSTEKQRSQA